MSDPNTPVGYEDLQIVGRGGFATVHRARQSQLDRTVAVKVIHAAVLDQATQRRFESECRSAGSLSWHPHVVVVFDAGTTPSGLPYLAMEYLDRGSLAARLEQDGPLDPRLTCSLGIQLADALEAAHRAGILHRDVKPENVMLDRFGNAKLADFGIAAVQGSAQTATGLLSATLAHCAPELFQGDRASVASDVYALSSTLFTLLAGHPPFSVPGQAGQAALMRRILEEPPPDLTAFAVPAGLAEVILRGLAKDPAARPRSAEALGRLLQDVQRQLGAPITPLHLDGASTNDADTLPDTPFPSASGDVSSRDTLEEAATPDPTDVYQRPGREPVAVNRKPPPVLPPPPTAAPAAPPPPPATPPRATPPRATPPPLLPQHPAKSPGDEPRDRSKRTKLLIGASGVAALVVVVALAFALIPDGNDDDTGAGSAATGAGESAGESAGEDSEPITVTGTAAELAASGTLRVGVAIDDARELGLQFPDELGAFDLRIAGILADGLGIDSADIKTFYVSPENREKLLKDGTVDFIVDRYTITTARGETVGLAGPYLLTGQRLLVPDGSTIKDFDDLAHKSVCAVWDGGAEDAPALGRLMQSGAAPKPASNLIDCIFSLLDGDVDAVTANGAELLGFAAGATEADTRLEVVAEPEEVVGYGVGYSLDSTGMCEFINTALQEAYDDGSWAEAFRETLGKSGVEPTVPPDLEPCPSTP